MATPRRPRRRRIAAGALALVALVAIAARSEARGSWLQSRYFTRQASQLTNEIGVGSSDRIRFPGDGPYDRRLGYARLPAALQTATGQGYRITAQARVSEGFADAVDRGVSPIFREKTQAGLRILDRYGATISESRYPERVYPSLDAVSPAVWRTLLLLEDRALLDPRFPNHNPSVDWVRMAQAGAAFAQSWLGSDRSVPGASTLATQLEKFRHFADGRTRSTRDKLLQMEAASLRSYLGGRNTEAARRRIVADYLNSVPLAAIAGHGEVTGLGDGLWAWYGADPSVLNRLLASDSAPVAPRAVAYRQVLSLLLAHRRPSYLLLRPEGREELRSRTDQHLRLVAREGIISAGLRDAALAVDVTPRNRAPDVPRVSFIERKGANAVRTELLGLTGVGTLYELDRFDLIARTTLDLQAQQQVTHLLARLTDPAFGLVHRGDPARIVYAVVLYERTADGNAVRVQVDNVDSPFNVVEGSKLELGSTAKLRTLISYLEIVERLHFQHAGQPAANLRAEPVGAGDWITVWALAYLAAHPGVSLEGILEAAMTRPYSARPDENLTGGHAVRNADTIQDSQVVSVRDAFIASVNLPFIRLMQDIVHYHVYRLPGNTYWPVAHSAEAPGDGDESRGQPVAARRIGSTREAGAFREIHRSWRRLGYPFASLAPSYETAIGSSADRPEGLAELVGIVLSGGVRYPVRRVDELHFAAGTPYETVLRPPAARGERVLSPEIAAVVRTAMVAVVTRGTAHPGAGTVRAVDGSPLPIGAKTGTGNNRYRMIGRDGRVIEDRAIDRTATVVFFIGDRFYGTITAFVSGASADRYGFTSALPVRILRMLGPTVEGLMARSR